MSATANAYSYSQFSSPRQSDGDPLHRQRELRDAWLTRHKITLDNALTLTDAGVNAFRGGHRQNPDRHALPAFVRLVDGGKVSKGSYLIVEALYRLSREHIRPALSLLLHLIESGIRVVQLLPSEVVYDESVEPMTLIIGIMELSRSHSESKMKSERIGAAWAKKNRTRP
ncbi:MAG TPA: recombinase family protein [Fimbriiglobus sp.]|jgi:DNA invertase Pin-like site-specific DNA recombinase